MGPAILRVLPRVCVRGGAGLAFLPRAALTMPPTRDPFQLLLLNPDDSHPVKPRAVKVTVVSGARLAGPLALPFWQEEAEGGDFRDALLRT